LEAEELREAGVSRARLRWAMNPVRSVLFHLARPYFEVITQAINRTAAETAATARATDEMRMCVREEAPNLAGVAAQLQEEARAGIRSELNHYLSAATIQVREEALAGVRAEVRRELAGSRTELRAMSHRFTSIEEMLHTISRWLEGVERHNAELSSEMRLELSILRQRIETAEIVATSDGVTPSPGAPGLFLAKGPYGRFLVRHPDVVGDAIIRGEFWDEHLRDVIETYADPDRIAIDAGAYIGFHSVFLSHHFAQVHAFEPQHQAYSLLRTNIELNGRRNIEATEIGLYNHPCWLQLAPDEMQEISVPRRDGDIDYGAISNAAALTFIKTDERTPDAVRAVTIDSFDFDRVGFIKIDTQGADFRVLQGAEETIRRCRPVIAFEFERDLSNAHDTRWEAFEGFIQGLGYNLTEMKRTPDGKQADYLARPA
jgi:FkbM family methyltransferase